MHLLFITTVVVAIGLQPATGQFWDVIAADPNRFVEAVLSRVPDVQASIDFKSSAKEFNKLRHEFDSKVSAIKEELGSLGDSLQKNVDDVAKGAEELVFGTRDSMPSEWQRVVENANYLFGRDRLVQEAIQLVVKTIPAAKLVQLGALVDSVTSAIGHGANATRNFETAQTLVRATQDSSDVIEWQRAVVKVRGLANTGFDDLDQTLNALRGANAAKRVILNVEADVKTLQDKVDALRKKMHHDLIAIENALAIGVPPTVVRQRFGPFMNRLAEAHDLAKDEIIGFSIVVVRRIAGF